MVENKQYISALDIGTSKVIALIGELIDDEIHIVGIGQAPSRGLKAGMVTNIDATAQAIKQAMSEAEHMADCKITHLVTGIAGNHIRSLNSQGVVKIKDGEVTQTDIERAKETAKAVNIPPDHQVLHTVVQEYIIDNQPGVREPIGMSGVRLDTRVHIITGAVTAMQNIQKCVQRCNLTVDDIMLQPLASASAVLTEDEKELGVCVIDIGGGTTDIAVYTNGAIRHTAVIPVAGDLITRDLAHALRTPSNSAEYIKINYGVALANIDGLDDMVEVPSVGDRRSRQISRRVLASVIQPRVEEIFDLPVRIGVPPEMAGLSERVRNPRYSTVIGLLQAAKERHQQGQSQSAGISNTSRRNILKKVNVDIFATENSDETDTLEPKRRPVQQPVQQQIEEPQMGWFARLREWINKTL